MSAGFRSSPVLDELRLLISKALHSPGWLGLHLKEKPAALNGMSDAPALGDMRDIVLTLVTYLKCYVVLPC